MHGCKSFCDACATTALAAPRCACHRPPAQAGQEAGSAVGPRASRKPCGSSAASDSTCARTERSAATLCTSTCRRAPVKAGAHPPGAHTRAGACPTLVKRRASYSLLPLQRAPDMLGQHCGSSWQGTLRPLERTLYCVCSSSLSASRRSSRRATSTSLVPASANLRAAAKPIPADAPATQKAYGLVWCSQTLVYAWTAALQSKTFAVNTPPLNLHGTPVTSTVQPLIDRGWYSFDAMAFQQPVW